MKRNRRDFLKTTILAGIGLPAARTFSACTQTRTPSMRFGLVTYQWGRDWELYELIENCKKTGCEGVELRTNHAHGVEVHLTAAERREVKKRFEESPVTCVGYGSNFEYHSPDSRELRENIEQTREYIKLCSDIGASGIKVKPNDIPDGVPEQKTITQIADSLNEVGRFAQDYGQMIRVEVHGRRTSELPVMRNIFKQVNEPNVKVCWNCNQNDLMPPGLEANFSMVKPWIGDTVHVREFNTGEYPYQELFNLLARMNYKGWILMEARTEPEDRITALKQQKRLFEQLVENANK